MILKLNELPEPEPSVKARSRKFQIDGSPLGVVKGKSDAYTRMMSKTRDDKKQAGTSRERIVETTARLLRVQGYHATGLNQIIEESHSPKGSLYHYFPQGKEELDTEAVDLAGHALLERLSRLLETEPELALDYMARYAIKELEDSDYQDGCPLATVSLETSYSSPVIRERCSEIFKRVAAIIEEWIKGQGLPEDVASTVAFTVLAAYEGALIFSKVHRSPDPLLRVVPQIKFYLAQCIKAHKP